ncbi:MAG: PspC protein [Bacteroidetes bacterium]|nr:PspC protein [Bacteroidota bacterium]
MEAQKKKIRRSEDRMIAGVCAGIAEYFGVDVKITRIVYFSFTIITAAFPGIILYLALMLLMPREGTLPTNED